VADHWGIHRRWIAHETGGYWDYCDFPLQEADEETIAAWPMPNPDDHDYSSIHRLCQAQTEYAIHVGGPGLGDIINSCGMLRGMEQTLVDLITENPAGLRLARRRTEITLEIARRTIEAAKGGVDFLWMGEDLGTQIAPIISLDLYRKTIRPLHRQFVELAKSFDLPVMIHTCGSSSWAYEDFIDMGIDVVDTLQPEAANMSPEYLKKTFGGRLAFHGCISTAGPVATGTVEETITHCRNTLDLMMPGGGYCFAPTHALQDNSPTENVVAMYETARKHGRY
jgi:uroporphyrinogen decarboxylase